MKKTITPAETPQEWDADALLAKAQRCVERMQSAPSDDWEHALWASFALEFLARAALSNVSPALLADTSGKNWQHLYHSLGFTPNEAQFSPRSIDTHEVFQRLGEILQDFDNELKTFCSGHTGRRNAELHSGATPFDGVEATGWHAKFYRACIVLLKSMGYELEEFLGEDENKVADQLIAAAKDEAAKAVKGDVNAHQKVWNSKPEEDRKRLALSAAAWATKQAGHRVKCPACASDALLNGEPVAAPHKTIEQDEITETQEYLPSQFECIACGLKILGWSRLNAVDLGSRYKKTLVYDAGEYYAPPDEYQGFEDDNNEPM